MACCHLFLTFSFILSVPWCIRPITRGRCLVAGGIRLFLSSGGAFGRCLVAGGLCCSYHQGAPSWLVRLGRIIVAGWGRSGRCAMEVRRFAAGRTRCVWRMHPCLCLLVRITYVFRLSFARSHLVSFSICARHRFHPRSSVRIMLGRWNGRNGCHGSGGSKLVLFVAEDIGLRDGAVFSSFCHRRF